MKVKKYECPDCGEPTARCKCQSVTGLSLGVIQMARRCGYIEARLDRAVQILKRAMPILKRSRLTLGDEIEEFLTGQEND